jgi:hypothetical protein
MFHDPALIEKLSEITPEKFSGTVYRATRESLDALTPSLYAGRWMPANTTSALYTSFEKDGALAEIAYHWSQLTPMPSKPARITRISVKANHTLKLLRANLLELGVPIDERYVEPLYERTQAIGAAVHFLGCDGLIVPSARWNCDNLILFTDSIQIVSDQLTVVDSELVDWLAWFHQNQEKLLSREDREWINAPRVGRELL